MAQAPQIPSIYLLATTHAAIPQLLLVLNLLFHS